MELSISLESFLAMNKIPNPDKAYDLDYTTGAWDIRTEDLVSYYPTRGDKPTVRELEDNEQLADDIRQIISDYTHQAMSDRVYRLYQERADDTLSGLVSFIHSNCFDCTQHKDIVEGCGINWAEEIVYIRFSPDSIMALLERVREIITGWGVYSFDSVQDMMDSIPADAEECLRQHKHYLFDGKLIDNIWGYGCVAREPYDNAYDNWSIDYAGMEKELVGCYRNFKQGSNDLSRVL